MLNQRMIHYLYFRHTTSSAPEINRMIPSGLYYNLLYLYSGYFPVNLVTFSWIPFKSSSFFRRDKVSTIISPTSVISSVVKPRVVIAGVPTRIPLVTDGDASSTGIVLLLPVILTSSSAHTA